ncbi:MAG: ABC transporter substrate-binding protein [Acidimicrobiia bacterium]|nr:ABC transporter substrate-binding protein [Acidimicrobiia bacterium]
MRRTGSPIGLVVILVMALVLAACGTGDDAAETTTTTAAETATTAGDTPEPTTTTTEAEAEPEPASVRVGLGNMPPSGMPYLGAGSPGQYVWSNMFDALTRIGPDGAPESALAESWSTADDNLTWTFNLRSGVTFSNGEPMDAAAVEATFATVLSEEGRATYSANANNYGFIDTVTAIDDSTIEIVTSSPNVLLPSAISIAYILPPAYFADAGAEGFAQAPIGSGPYAVSEWGDDEIVLEAWAGSWRGEPQIATVTYLNLPDPAARVQALQSGQIDIAQSPSPDQADSLISDGFEIYSATRGQVLAMALVTDQGGPLADVRVRQALNYAVDKEAIREALTGGFSPTAGLYAPPGVNGHDGNRFVYPYDPDLARELLAEAGYADGFDIEAEMTLGSFPADAEIFEAMAGYLADVGVNVTITQVDFRGEWLPKFLGTDGADWSGNAFNYSWGTAPLFDAIRPFNFYQCGWTNAWYCDEEAMPLIEAVNTTFDAGERNAVLAQLLDHTAENPPSVMLTENFELWAHTGGISNFNVFAFNAPFDDVSSN